MIKYLNFKYITFVGFQFVHLIFYISHVLFRCHGKMGRSNGRSSVTANTKTHSTALDHKINGTTFCDPQIEQRWRAPLIVTSWQGNKNVM